MRAVQFALPMKTVRRLLILAVVAAAATQAGVIWDYSPAGLTLTTGYWTNEPGGQNFAEIVSFSTGASVTGYDHYTGASVPLQTEFRLKLLADAGGQPGTLLQQFDLLADSVVLDGTYYANYFGDNEDIYRYSFSFPAIILAPGVSYWIGMSGASGDVNQAGVQAPGNSQMAQFYGGSFDHMTQTLVGDQSFRLSGELGDFTGQTPEPGTLALLGLGLLSVALLRRTA